MEEVSRFSGFASKVVPSGSKVQGSAFPTLTATSTKDKFNLNQKALALMGLTEGDNIAMLDVNRGEVTTEDSNSRWYITAGWDKGKGQMEGAKIGKGGSFSYSGIYSAIQMNKPDIAEATVRDLVGAGKGIIRQTESGADSFIATQKVQFKVEKLAEEDADGNLVTDFEVAKGVFQKVYALTEMEVIPHTPKEVGEGDDEDTDE